MVYLGSVIHEDGRAVTELSRRLGQSKALFNKLSRVWSHSSITPRRKVEIFNAVVVSKLTYGLCTLWLGAADQRKLDGFQAYYLRRIGRIPSAYLSRMSHKKVLEKFQQRPLSCTILRQQLLYLGKVANLPVRSPLRSVTFHGDSLRPCTDAWVRKVGRPRQDS